MKCLLPPSIDADVDTMEGEEEGECSDQRRKQARRRSQSSCVEEMA